MAKFGREALGSASVIAYQNQRLNLAVQQAAAEKEIAAYAYLKAAIEVALDKDVPGWRTKEIVPARFK